MHYSLNWEKSCDTYVKTNKEEYENCLNQFSKSLCDTYPGKVAFDSNGVCLLPKTKSESIEQNVEEEKEECYKKYELEMQTIN